MSLKNQQDDVYIKFHRSILSRMCRLCGFHSTDMTAKNDEVMSYPTFKVDALSHGVDVSNDHEAVFPTKMCRWCKEQIDSAVNDEKDVISLSNDLFQFVPHGIDCRICKLSCPTCLLTINSAQHRIKKSLSQEDQEYIDDSNLSRHKTLQDAVLTEYGKEFLNNDQRKIYKKHTADCQLCFRPCFTCGCHPKHDPKAQFIISCPEPKDPVGRMILRTRKRKAAAGPDDEEDISIPKQTIIHPLPKTLNGKPCNMYPSIKIKSLVLSNASVQSSQHLVNTIKVKPAYSQAKQFISRFPQPITIAAKPVSNNYFSTLTPNPAQSLKYRAIQIRNTQPTANNFTTFKNINNLPTPISKAASSPVVLSLTTGPSTLILQNVITGTSTSSAKQEIPILSTGIQNGDNKKFNIKILPGANNHLISNNDLLMHKINTAKNIMSPIEHTTKMLSKEVSKPPGSIEFGKVPHQVATSFHKIFVSHGSLTAAVKTTLSMRSKLRYKYQFIDRDKTKLCVLLGMPTSTDNLFELRDQLNILDRYVCENQLVSRASAIEELLFSPLNNIEREKKMLDELAGQKLDGYIQNRKLKEMMKTCSKIDAAHSEKTDTHTAETPDSNNTDHKAIIRSVDISHRHNLRKVIQKTKRFSQSPPRERTEMPKNKVLKSVMDQTCQGYDISKILPKLLKHDSHIGCRLTTLINYSFLSIKNKQINHTCYACGEMVQQDKFSQHAWDHFQFNKYSCSYCKLKFKDQVHMKAHIVTKICFKEGVQNESNQQAPRPKNYTGIIPYFYRPFVVTRVKKLCNLCNYTANDINLMTFHARQHVGDYPFRCAMCGFASVCKGRLTKHQKSTKHAGFLVIKRSTAPSPQLINELESSLNQNLLLFNHLGYIEEEAENNRLRKVAENKNKYSKPTASSKVVAEKKKITTTTKASILFSASLQKNKGKNTQPRQIKPKPVPVKPVRVSSKPASNWTFCEVCNSAFLDTEAFDLHKQECNSNLESKNWDYEKSDGKKPLPTPPLVTSTHTAAQRDKAFFSKDTKMLTKTTSKSSLLGLATKLADRASILVSTANTNPVSAADNAFSISTVSRRALRKQKPHKRIAKTQEDSETKDLAPTESCKNQDMERSNEDLNEIVTEIVSKGIKSEQIECDTQEEGRTSNVTSNNDDDMEIKPAFENDSMELDLEDPIVNIVQNMIADGNDETSSAKKNEEVPDIFIQPIDS